MEKQLPPAAPEHLAALSGWKRCNAVPYDLCPQMLMSSVKDSLPQPASQQICVHGLGPHLGVLATWDLRRMPSTQTRHRHRHSLSHRWPSALCLVSWHASLPMSMSSGHEPAACAHCDASQASACQEQLATLSHIMLSCPVSQAV